MGWGNSTYAVWVGYCGLRVVGVGLCLCYVMMLLWVNGGGARCCWCAPLVACVGVGARRCWCALLLVCVVGVMWRCVY